MKAVSARSRHAKQRCNKGSPSLYEVVFSTPLTNKDVLGE